MPQNNGEPPEEGQTDLTKITGDEAFYPRTRRRLPFRYLKFPEPDPADFLPSPPKVRGPMAWSPRREALRPALLCFALFWVASLLHWRGEASLYAQQRAVFVDGEWWRLFTALFTHSGVGHLAANTPLFLIFGWFLRAHFGLWVFPGLAFVVGALSNLWTIWTYAPETRLVGASGMLYGMVAMWLVYYIRFARDYDVPMRIFRSIGVSLVLLFPTTFDEDTSYMAHGTGFVVGLVLSLIAVRFSKEHEEMLISPYADTRHPERSEGPLLPPSS